MPHKHRKLADVPDLNLTPIMGLLVILIPILLFTFTFFEVKIQAVAAPRMGPSKAKQDENEKKPLNLTVLITKKGFVMKQQAELTGNPELPILKREYEFRGKSVVDYDYPQLYNKLMEKKRQYPEEVTINIGAEPDIPWRYIARTIDCSRLQLEKDSYEDMEGYAKAPPRKSGKEIVDLFPTVVFVVAE